MQLPVLIEPLNNHGYRATIGPPVAVAAEGATREEALGQLRHALDERLRGGAEISALEISLPEPTLARYAGMFKDNPLFDAWQEAIAGYRQQADEESERP